MRQEWHTRAQRLGLDLPQRTVEAYVRGPLFVSAEQQREAAQTAVTFAHEHMTERDAVMHTRMLATTALQRGMGKIVLEETRSEIQRQTGQGILVPVTAGLWAGQGYTTQEMLNLEQENLALMHAGQGQASPLVAVPAIEAWARHQGLDTEQTHVVRQTLTSRHWLSAIEGKAGATKTTMIGAMREILTSHGHIVRGFGPTTGSVRALQEAGLEVTTVASLLTRPFSSGSARGEVWIVDESSLLATRQGNTLFHRAREAQVARVVFVGDQRQHGAIEAGRPIAQLQRAGMETVQLATIRRQRDPELRKAVELAANGKTKDAVALLVSHGRVTEIAEADKRAEAMAHEYVRSVAVGQQVLVVSPSNAERTVLNATIRTALQGSGHLAEGSITHRVLVNRHVTGVERGWARSYAVGDVLRYRTGSKKLGLAAGTYVRVAAIDAERNHLTIRTEGGMTHTYSPTKLKGVEVYREEERPLVEGERIQFRAPLKTQNIPNGALGRIEKLDPESSQVTLTLDRGSSFSTTLQEVRHIEYGYATTSHSSQGTTIDRVLVHIDTEQSVALVNQQQFYVSIPQARQDVQIFTNKQDELSEAVSRSWPKAIALEAVAQSQDVSKYAKQQNKGRNSGATRQHDKQQHIDASSVRQCAPVSLPGSRAPSDPGHQRHQIDAALLVSHRQTDWRREHRQPRPEQTVVHSLTEHREERPAQSLRHEETSEQKSERSRGIRYSR